MLQEQDGEDYLHSAFIGNSLGIGLCLSPHSHISNVLWRMGYQQQLIQLSKFKEDNNRRNEIGDDKGNQKSQACPREPRRIAAHKEYSTGEQASRQTLGGR